MPFDLIYCEKKNWTLGEEWAFWDARVSFEDMDAMWNNPEVVREWAKSGERRGRVRFSLDAQKKPYLSRVEVKVYAFLYYYFLGIFVYIF